MDISKVKAYQEGIVTKEVICSWNCEVPMSERAGVFSYIKLVLEDGSEQFLYEDEEWFHKFEEDFHNKRFTSYHDFFTTKKLLTENRGIIKLDYYERRPKECYEICSLKEAKEALKDVEKLPDAVSGWGKYPSKVE